MDKEWQHLINAIYSLNGFSWTDAVSIYHYCIMDYYCISAS